jgi:hypothetical protein
MMRLRQQGEIRKNLPIFSLKSGWIVLVLSLTGMWLLSACATNATPTPAAPAATITLIPPTATYTAISATATPTSVIDAEVTIPELASTTPTATAGGSLIDVDPIASQLTFIARRLVADQTSLPTRRIRVVTVSAVTWTDSSLGCPLPDEVYLPIEIDGYRIVLEAGETTYIFHTDIDRVVPCAAENEVLPESTAESTAEVTAESTGEATEAL